MADVLFLALIAALFVTATLLVRLCDRVIGPAEETRDVVEDIPAREAA
jgi:hypothetical protein